MERAGQYAFHKRKKNLEDSQWDFKDKKMENGVQEREKRGDGGGNRWRRAGEP